MSFLDTLSYHNDKAIISPNARGWDHFGLIYTPIVVTPVPVNYAKVINSGYSHISEPALELQSRAAPSVRGNITAQSVQPQGEILEEGRRKKKLNS